MDAAAPDAKTGLPPQIVFVHLPKTGGFALHAALERGLPAGSVLRIGDSTAQAAFRSMRPADVARYRLVSGHFTFEEALALAPPGARFATLLRDPVARLLSAFNYMSCRQLTGRSTAAEAIPVLESCYGLVGTTERLTDVSLHLHRWLDLPPQAPGRENVTAGQGRITLTCETCEQLLDLTREDRALYRHIADRHAGLMLHSAYAAA
ncbi:MAG: hypothetical protein B7Z53_01765 [Rhodospirillales bacterium 12-71-4]|nr:MAG: hypothetical protein B7Z53_01765 [Rhodospirillales bacterium 12-71-4]